MLSTMESRSTASVEVNEVGRDLLLVSWLAAGASRPAGDAAEDAYREIVRSLAERDCVREESRSFLQRVYGGAFMPMLAAMLEDQKLSAEQIDDLKQILARKGENQ